MFIGLATSTEVLDTSRTADEARNLTDRVQWERAMSDELASHNHHQTWNVVNQPHEMKLLSGKWVFKKKLGTDSSVSRFIARWVVRGFEQQHSWGYDQTFAAVDKPALFRLVFALAATHDWEIEELNIKTAFLYGKIDTEVFVEQPHGFQEGDMVCQLRQFLYRLKQSLHLWYLTISNYLCSNGFYVAEADPGVLINKKGIIHVLYVNDVLLIGPCMGTIDKVKVILRNEYQMADTSLC
jgi:hypothetical protein